MANYSSVDDSQLVQALALARGGPEAGDALNLLVAKHVHFVYSACARQLGDERLADRATSATFVLLARHADRLTGERSLVPWLFNTAYHACRSVRKNKTDGLAGGAGVYLPPTDWSKIASGLDEALARLGGQSRDAVLLKYFANLPLREVARVLDVSDLAAGQRISAGVARLRARFERANVLVAPEALVAAMQAHGVQAAPAAAGQNAIYAVGMAVQPGAAGQPAAVIAEHVMASLRRAKWMAAGSAACVAILAGVVGFKIVSMVKSGRLFAAGTRPATRQIDRATVNRQGEGGGEGAAGSRVGRPEPVLPKVDSPAPVPKPVVPVDPELAGRFVQAIRRGDFNAVEQMANEEEGLINAKDPKSGRGAIEVAAELVLWQRGDATRIAHFLIDNGAVTDVHTAARAGHASQVARLLLRDLSKMNAKDGRGLTAMQRAALIEGASPDCEQVVDMLIQAGAHVDLWTACTFARLEDVRQALADDTKLVNAPVLGAMPLHWAARPRRHTEDPLAIPKLLLEKGADPLARDVSRDGMTPLHHAAEWGAPPALAQLLLEKGVDVNVPDDYGWTPMDYAIARNRREMADFLASKGGKRTTVDPPNQPMKTPRMFTAVMGGDDKQTKILLDDTPDLAKTRGPTGETPLHHAAAGGHVAIIDLLLTDKADINAQETNKYGGTPLHWAVRQKQVEAVKHLLSKGADAKAINSRNSQTLLHVAAQGNDDPALVDLILSKGVDPAAEDRFGKTALDYAKQANHTRVAQRLAGK